MLSKGAIISALIVAVVVFGGLWASAKAGISV